MNERTKKLIDDLENSRLSEFNMETFQDCGTPLCIAGHCAARAGRTDLAHISTIEFLEIVVDFFEIRLTIAGPLCGCRDRENVADRIWGDIPMWDASQPQAAQAIRRAIEMSDSLKGQ